MLVTVRQAAQMLGVDRETALVWLRTGAPYASASNPARPYPQLQAVRGMAILGAFKEAGIAIPFGQPDATQLKLDWLRDMIAESAARPAERHAGNGSRAFASNGKAPAASN